MEATLTGVIPLNHTNCEFISMSLSRLVAVGLKYSVYVYDASIGENIARINHYPHIATSAAWHPKTQILVTADSDGSIILSYLLTMTWEKFSIAASPIKYLNFHMCGNYIFALSQSHLKIFDLSQKLFFKDFEIIGFKILTDFFCPQKIIVLSEKNVKVVRWGEKQRNVSEGKVENVVDAVVHPSVINTIFLLSRFELAEYNTVIFT